jgi:hypothetical protein
VVPGTSDCFSMLMQPVFHLLLATCCSCQISSPFLWLVLSGCCVTTTAVSTLLSPRSCPQPPPLPAPNTKPIPSHYIYSLMPTSSPPLPGVIGVVPALVLSLCLFLRRRTNKGSLQRNIQIIAGLTIVCVVSPRSWVEKGGGVFGGGGGNAATKMDALSKHTLRMYINITYMHSVYMNNYTHMHRNMHCMCMCTCFSTIGTMFSTRSPSSSSTRTW